MAEIPTLCAQCLGNKDHVKMVRQPHGEQCKLCTRPFTVFRWNLEVRHKLSKTVLCKTCSAARNCCQSCTMDVDYGIPIDIRDAALKMAHVENPFAVETTSRNPEVRAIMADKLEAKKHSLDTEGQDDKRAKAKAILETLRAKLSSEGAKSARPKAKVVDVSSKDLAKTISKLPFGGTLQTPEDASVKSFFVFGFSQDLPQYELVGHFEKYGPVALVKVVHQARCGYVSYTKRSSAEAFAQYARTDGLSQNPKTAGLVTVGRNELVRVSWGSPRPLSSSRDESSKLLQVVAKVMKQLAAKDEDSRRDGRKTATKGDLRHGDLGTRLKHTYKALSNDVEL